MTQYDKTPEGYDYHVNVDHNIWNYLFYIYHIRKEEETEYTGVDSYVAGMLKKEDIFWFPIGKSLALAQLHENSSTLEQFTQVFSKIKHLTEVGNELMGGNDSHTVPRNS